MARNVVFFAVFSLTLGCSQDNRRESGDQSSMPMLSATQPTAAGFPAKLTTEYLANPVQIHEQVISGGLPKGASAFRELVDLGVKTIISVDGAKPDVATAHSFGIRYVHLPHGYNGIPRQRVLELAKAVRDLDGPIYIHCHHGKHRSPAAGSVACVSAGLIPESQAVRILQLAGTDPNYRGLYSSARNAFSLEAALLDELQVDFQETVQVPPLAEAMVQLGQAYDRLEIIAEAGWKISKDHPDLEPAHEALLIREHFTELLRTEDVRKKPAGFQKMLRDSELAAMALEVSLRQSLTTGHGFDIPREIPAAASRIAANCRSCHVRFRDVALKPK